MMNSYLDGPTREQPNVRTDIICLNCHASNSYTVNAVSQGNCRICHADLDKSVAKGSYQQNSYAEQAHWRKVQQERDRAALLKRAGL
jgi:hypothetical protein